MADQGVQTGIILSTAIAAVITGYMFGVFTTRGYLISPELVEERRRNLADPVESDESDVDEDDSLLDHAPNWANGADADRKQGLKAESTKLKDTGEECKLVLVVRTDLGMTKGTTISSIRRHQEQNMLILLSPTGKIAAQCSHATLACYKAMARAPEGSAERKMLARWEKYGQAKIAVQVKSQEDILELRRKARGLGLMAEVIQDAGRTQIEAGSMTVLGVGPAPRSVVDQVTGGLKLL
jgi:PTH2 family peptidyl-tRNA hydrolase